MLHVAAMRLQYYLTLPYVEYSDMFSIPQDSVALSTQDQKKPHLAFQTSGPFARRGMALRKQYR